MLPSLTAPLLVHRAGGAIFTKISERSVRTVLIRKAAPAAPNAISRGPQHPEEDSVGTWAPAEERRVTPPECALRGAMWRELTAAAPVPKAGAGGDVSGARPNWDTISASPDQPSTRDPEKRGKSGSTREKGATRLSVAATPTLRDLLRPWASPGQGSDKTRTGKAVKRATQVVPGASPQAHASPTHAS